MIWLNGDRLELTGPDGATPWIVQLDDAEHPVEVVERIVSGLVGEPILLHSTSWRRDGAAVILSFVVVIGPEQRAGMATAPIRRAGDPRSPTTSRSRFAALDEETVKKPPMTDEPMRLRCACGWEPPAPRTRSSRPRPSTANRCTTCDPPATRYSRWSCTPGDALRRRSGFASAPRSWSRSLCRRSLYRLKSRRTDDTRPKAANVRRSGPVGRSVARRPGSRTGTDHRGQAPAR